MGSNAENRLVVARVIERPDWVPWGEACAHLLAPENPPVLARPATDTSLGRYRLPIVLAHIGGQQISRMHLIRTCPNFTYVLLICLRLLCHRANRPPRAFSPGLGEGLPVACRVLSQVNIEPPGEPFDGDWPPSSTRRVKGLCLSS